MRVAPFRKKAPELFPETFIISVEMATTKTSIANLKAEAAKKILNGEVSEGTLKAIINLGEESPDIVIRVVDILAGGKVKEHLTTKKEAIQYVSRSDSYDALLEEIKTERKRYLGQVANAEKGRAVLNKGRQEQGNKEGDLE